MLDAVFAKTLASALLSGFPSPQNESGWRTAAAGHFGGLAKHCWGTGRGCSG